jgi:hypothetical protein
LQKNTGMLTPEVSSDQKASTTVIGSIWQWAASSEY